MKSFFDIPFTFIAAMIFILGCADKGQTCAVNDEDCTGIIKVPEDTKQVDRYTNMRVHIQLPSAWTSSTMNNPGYQSEDVFNPTLTESFLISDPLLVITDSQNNTHPIKLYLIPMHSTNNDTTDFVVFVTVNDIAINTMRLNSQHTSFFQKFGTNQNIDVRSTYRPSTGAPNDYPVIEWFGGIIRATGNAGQDVYSREELFTQWPRTTVDPVYDKATSTNTKQVDSAPLQLQYIAPVGMNQFDWAGISLPCCYPPLSQGKSDQTITEQALGESNQIYGNRGTENIIAKYTTVEYPQKRKTEDYDVGWHGLDINYRNTIKRYQITQLNFTYETLITPSDNLIIPADGISVSSWDAKDGKVPPVSTGNQELTLDYKINAP